MWGLGGATNKQFFVCQCSFFILFLLVYWCSTLSLASIERVAALVGSSVEESDDFFFARHVCVRFYLVVRFVGLVRCVACILCSHFHQSLLLECVNDPCVWNVSSEWESESSGCVREGKISSYSLRRMPKHLCTVKALSTHQKRHTNTLYRFGGFDFPIVNINYNEVYKHCLFIVMYYDVQWSDYRRTFISLDSIHSHNILVGSVYSLKWLHI